MNKSAFSNGGGPSQCLQNFKVVQSGAWMFRFRKGLETTRDDMVPRNFGNHISDPRHGPDRVLQCHGIFGALYKSRSSLITIFVLVDPNLHDIR